MCTTGLRIDKFGPDIRVVVRIMKIMNVWDSKVCPLLINHRRACAARVTVCRRLCPCVDAYSGTTGHEAAYKRH